MSSETSFSRWKLNGLQRSSLLLPFSYFNKWAVVHFMTTKIMGNTRSIGKNEKKPTTFEFQSLKSIPRSGSDLRNSIDRNNICQKVTESYGKRNILGDCIDICDLNRRRSTGIIATDKASISWKLKGVRTSGPARHFDGGLLIVITRLTTKSDLSIAAAGPWRLLVSLLHWTHESSMQWRTIYKQ